MSLNNPGTAVTDSTRHATHFLVMPRGSFYLGVSTGQVDVVDIGFDKLMVIKSKDTILHVTNVDSVMKLFSRNPDGGYSTPFRIEIK